MADVPTQIDLFDAGRTEAILSPTRFDRAIIDTPGSDVNIVMNVAAAMGEEVARFLQTAINEQTLANATGEALDRWVYDRYQMTRKDAAAAVATLSVTRTDPGVGFTIPKFSRFGTVDGIVYEVQNAISFANGQLGPLTVVATATQTGEDGNVPAGAIDQVLASLPDNSVLVTNSEPAAGGRETETDDALRDRARQFFTTARRGTKEAIEFGALEVQRVSQANASEFFDEGTGLPAYRVQLIINDPDGQANLALAAEVERELDDYRALGVPVLTVPATPQYVTITATGLLFEAGANTSEVLGNATAALLALINGLQPGATLRRADVLRTLSGVSQLIVPDGALVEPVGDLVPTLGTVIRTSEDRIAISG